MPAVANIVLADAQGTPVNHTFVPVNRDSEGTFYFEDQSRPTPLGYWRISLKLKRALPGAAGTSSADAGRVNRVVVTLHEPQLEVNCPDGCGESGFVAASSIAYITRSTTEFILPERTSVQDRKDIRKMMQNLLANTLVMAMVENLEAVY